jgi:NitT/TauT family transport system substrate-binding protein
MNLKINKKIIVILATIILIGLIVASAFFYLNTIPNSGKLESITLGEIPSTPLGLLFIAQNQSYYAQNSLNVTLQNYPFGVPALNDLISGKIDVAALTEYPFVGQVLNNANLTIISSFGKAETGFVIAREGAGIQSASDLIGKKIAITPGGIGQFYFDRYLSLNGIDKSSIEIVNAPTGQLIDTLVNGTVDGIQGDFTSLSLAQSRIGSNLTILPIQVGQPVFLNLICRNNWVANHTQTIEKLLKALYQSEQYYQNSPQKAQSIILNSLNLTSVNPATWTNSQFSLSLEQPLVIAMKDEAQWMINNHLTNQTRVPNMVDYVYTDGLKAVKPDAVTIIK